MNVLISRIFFFAVPEPEIKPQTSSSSAEPTPKKTKAKKNKIKIEETEDVLEVDQTPAAAVVTEPIVPIEENVVVVEEKKQSKPKKNKESKEDANGTYVIIFHEFFVSYFSPTWRCEESSTLRFHYFSNLIPEFMHSLGFYK